MIIWSTQGNSERTTTIGRPKQQPSYSKWNGVARHLSRLRWGTVPKGCSRSGDFSKFLDCSIQCRAFSSSSAENMPTCARLAKIPRDRRDLPKHRTDRRCPMQEQISQIPKLHTSSETPNESWNNEIWLLAVCSLQKRKQNLLRDLHILLHKQRCFEWSFARMPDNLKTITLHYQHRVSYLKCFKKVYLFTLWIAKQQHIIISAVPRKRSIAARRSARFAPPCRTPRSLPSPSPHPPRTARTWKAGLNIRNPVAVQVWNIWLLSFKKSYCLSSAICK